MDYQTKCRHGIGWYRVAWHWPALARDRLGSVAPGGGVMCWRPGDDVDDVEAERIYKG